MSDEKIEADVADTIYAAALIFEGLEHKGLVVGNGHHLAQKVTDYAVELYRKAKVKDKNPSMVGVSSKLESFACMVEVIENGGDAIEAAAIIRNYKRSLDTE